MHTLWFWDQEPMCGSKIYFKKQWFHPLMETLVNAYDIGEEGTIDAIFYKPQ